MIYEVKVKGIGKVRIEADNIRAARWRALRSFNSREVRRLTAKEIRAMSDRPLEA